jgi:hypothetical protein
VPAENDRGSVPPLDQHPVSVLPVQVERAAQGIEVSLPGPVRHPLQQALGYPYIFEVLEKTEDAFPTVVLGVYYLVLPGADRAYRLSIAPGGEKLRLPALEECPLPGIDGFRPLREERGNPQRIVAVDLPGEGEKPPFVPPGSDQADFDSTHGLVPPFAVLRASSSLTISS